MNNANNNIKLIHNNLYYLASFKEINIPTAKCHVFHTVSN